MSPSNAGFIEEVPSNYKLADFPRDSTMKDLPLIDFIVTALVNLGGQRHLSEIYQEVERLGYGRGGRDLHKAIRKRIYEHSSDSPQFTGKRDDDYFHTDKIGSRLLAIAK
jgi:hypothetical protein